MYKMVEGLMPAETFLIPQKQGHQIKSSTATDILCPETQGKTTSKTITDATQCHGEQYKQ